MQAALGGTARDEDVEIVLETAPSQVHVRWLGVVITYPVYAPNVQSPASIHVPIGDHACWGRTWRQMLETRNPEYLLLGTLASSRSGVCPAIDQSANVAACAAPLSSWLMRGFRLRVAWALTKQAPLSWVLFAEIPSRQNLPWT